MKHLVFFQSQTVKREIHTLIGTTINLVLHQFGTDNNLFIIFVVFF